MDTALGMLVVFVVMASVVAWANAFFRWRAGHQLLRYEPRRPVPWGLVDVVVVVFLVMSAGVAGELLLQGQFGIPATKNLEELEPADRVIKIFAASTSSLLAVAASLVLLAIRTGSRWRDLGFQPSQLLADVKLGVMAFVMLAPPVYAIQLALVQYFESKHPLIELLKQQPDPLFLALCGFSAVIVAPLAEELVFRVILQGWLEKSATQGVSSAALFLGGKSDEGFDSKVAPAQSGSGVEGSDTESLPDVTTEQTDNASNPYESPRDVSDSGAADKEEADPAFAPRIRPAFWPVIVSALLFSLLHLQHGPDWIALFFLAVGLGFLYQRTHRIVPSIVVHLLLNAVSLLALAAELFRAA